MNEGCISDRNPAGPTRRKESNLYFPLARPEDADKSIRQFKFHAWFTSFAVCFRVFLHFGLNAWKVHYGRIVESIHTLPLQVSVHSFKMLCVNGTVFG